MANFKKTLEDFKNKMKDTKITKDEQGQTIAIGTNPKDTLDSELDMLEQQSRTTSKPGFSNDTKEMLKASLFQNEMDKGGYMDNSLSQSYDTLKDASIVSAPFATMMKSPTFNEIASGIKPYSVGEEIQKSFTTPAKLDVEKNKEVYKNTLERYKALAEKKKLGLSSEEGLRKEIAPHLKRFSDIDIAYNKILKAVSKPSAANDVTLVYNFMKMQDPGSTVREGEYATAANAAGIPDRVKAMYNRALKGETLAPTQRNDFANAARSTYSAEKETYDMITGGYKKVADRTGADWENIDVFGSNRAGAKQPVITTVRVTNGKEILDIPKEDLEDAKRDGYNEVK